MRDIRAGRDINIGGDLNVSVPSEGKKSLEQFSDDELLSERARRRNLVKHETKRKWKVSLWLMLGVSSIGLIMSAYLYWDGKKELATLALAFISAGGPLWIAHETLSSSSDFEKRQLAILKEISILLKERGH